MAKLSADEKRARALARSLVLRERGRGEFAGTREQLIAAGLAQPGDFPGDPECPCKVRHSFERDDRHFQVRVRSFTAEPRSFVLRRSITNAERIKLDAERRSELEANDPNFRNDASIARELEEREARIRAAIKAGEYLPLSCREPHEWLTAWVGTREELTAAGICDAPHFPQGRKRVARGDADDESAAQRRPGVKSWQTRALGRDYFEHIVWWNKEAQLARIRDGIGRKPIERPSYYADIDAFAKGCEQSVMFASRLVEERLNGTLEADMHGACTVRYDDETVRSVIAALEHARQLLQASIPHFVTRTPSKRVKSARADARFVKFLSGIGLAPNAGRSD